ncbi:MAG: penicillin-binding transpeptidase domain-containing protein [Evtepia gabavorous]
MTLTLDRDLQAAAGDGLGPAFFDHHAALSQDEAHPLMNRAVQGLYAPGSTFKLVTAAAALEEGFLTPETQILDTGRYTYYKSPQPQCWLYRQEGKTHGLETVSEAIADSCNIFYDAGRRVGIDMLGQYARALGLGKRPASSWPESRPGWWPARSMRLRWGHLV